MVEGRHFPQYMSAILVSALLAGAVAMPLTALALPAPKSPNAMTPSLTNVEEVGILAPSLPAKPETPPETPKPAPVQSGDAPLFPDEPPPPPPSNDFLSFGYMARVAGTLAFLLGAFYLVSKILFKRSVHAQPSADWAQANSSSDMIPSAPSSQGILHQLFSRLHLSPSIQLAQRTQWLLTPRTLTRTRLGPGREILVMQVAQRLLVVAATPSSMSLLTELPMDILNEAKEDTMSPGAESSDPLMDSIISSSSIRREPSRLNELIDKTVDKYLSPDRKLTIVPDNPGVDTPESDLYAPTRSASFTHAQSDDFVWDEEDAMTYAHSWTEASPERYVASTEVLKDYDDRY